MERRQYEYYKKKIKVKIQFYQRKYGRTVENELPDESHGITIRDQEIPEEYKKSAKCYGGSELSEAEKEVLA